MLKFRVTGRAFSWYLAKELEILTDKATVETERINFDNKAKIVSVPLRRYELAAEEHAKRRLLTSYRYDRHRSINAMLVIRNVVDCHIERADCGLQEIELVLGAQLRKDYLLLRSAQESRGKSCLFLKARFAELDLSLEDVMEAKKK